jgi:hypothetical protein
MSRFKILCVLIMSSAMLVRIAPSQQDEREHESCSYSLLHNGPTWDADSMAVPYDVAANAWARDGAYGGSGRSFGMGLHGGGAGVGVAAVSYWFKVTHFAVESCVPVKFESTAMLRAEVATDIHGDSEDYALATGFQSISGNALRPASLAVAATNAGFPVQESTVAVSFGAVGFTLTIPGVSVTTDTLDRDRNTIYTWGAQKIEEEQITVHCWTKVKVVTNGPFGGTATASVDYTHVNASTVSTCAIHQQTGSYVHDVSEG